MKFAIWFFGGCVIGGFIAWTAMALAQRSLINTINDAHKAVFSKGKTERKSGVYSWCDRHNLKRFNNRCAECDAEMEVEVNRFWDEKVLLIAAADVRGFSVSVLSTKARAE